MFENIGKYFGREFTRGIWHALTCSLPGWLVLYMSWKEATTLQIRLSCMALVVLAVGVLWWIEHERRAIRKGGQLSAKWKEVIRDFFEKHVVRDNEMKRATNGWHYLAGIIPAIIFAPPWIIVGVSFIAATIDPVAKLGKIGPIVRFTWGWMRKKSLGGLIYGFTAGLATLFVVATMIFGIGGELIPPDVSWWTALVVYGFGTLAGSLAELLTIKFDNITIPVSSLLVMLITYGFS